MDTRGILLGLLAVIILFVGITMWAVSHSPKSAVRGGFDISLIYRNPRFWVAAFLLFGLVYWVDAKLLH
jgi:hypothetical protein